MDMAFEPTTADTCHEATSLNFGKHLNQFLEETVTMCQHSEVIKNEHAKSAAMSY
jgi:hypothetical protein